MRDPRRPITALALLLGALLLSACTAPAPAAPEAAEVGAPATAAIDDRAYRTLTLANGLEVLVISDPETDRGAAALAVDVGSFAEPADRQGLAHFLEHMLFLGTEKYPSPDEYAEYISRHGGDRNAYTALDHTNYFFSISADQLRGALDRFSQFFVAPLFTAEYVAREKSAVHSEYQLQLKDDGWRTYMTQKRALNPAHPGSRFTIGSLATLEDRQESSVRDELLEFYRAHYSADRMGLVILGREDLDTLAGWAEELFGPVPRQETAAAEPDVPMFAPGALPQLMRIVPVRERRALEFSFPVPPLDDVYRVDPAGYLTNLIGHEGEGSLHDWLSEQGWIEALGAGAQRFGEHNASVDVTVELTEDGLDHWREVGAALFAYLELLRDGGIEAWRYEEQARLARLAFDYQEKADPYRYVSRLAGNLLEYPAEDVIRGPLAMDRFDRALVEDYLARLVPQNVNVTLIAPGLETTEVEPWFDVPYAVEPLDVATLEAWRSAPAIAALALPERNPFVPEDLTLVAEADAEVPEPLVQQPGLEVWYLRDPSFGAPRAQLRVDLRTRHAVATAEENVLAMLYARLVNDALNAYAYPARLAGLSYGLGPTADGLSLSLGGFDDRLDVLLERVLATMTDLEVRPDRFEHFRSELLRDLRNTRQDRPYQQAMAELRRLLETSEFPLDDLIEATEAADRAALLEWMPRALEGPRTVALFHGNLTRDRALALAEALAEGVAAPDAPGATLDPALVRLPEAEAVHRRVEIDHPDAALALYVQGRDQSWDERARYGLLAHMLSTPYFNALRTERQFGYVVSAGAWVRMNTPGLYFVVQSPKVPPSVIAEATGEFLDAFGERLEALTEAEFETERQGLLSRLLERDENLGERSSRLWRDLDGRITSFDSRERIADALRALDLLSFRAFYAAFRDRAARSYAAVWSPGRFPLPDAAPAGRTIEDVTAFKATRPAWTAADAVAGDPPGASGGR